MFDSETCAFSRQVVGLAQNRIKISSLPGLWPSVTGPGGGGTLVGTLRVPEADGRTVAVTARAGPTLRPSHPALTASRPMGSADGTQEAHGQSTGGRGHPHLHSESWVFILRRSVFGPWGIISIYLL